MSKAKIGFIGLGLMGAAMVERLQACGYEMVLLGNRSRTRLEAALARGATEAADAKSLAEAADIIMICVGTSEQVESRMYGESGVLAGLSAGKIVIDFGTSLPASTIALGAEAEAKGAAYLDAPLGRPPAMALEGRLNIMGAGDQSAFDRVRPVLDDLGENVFHLGPLGTGHKIKLLNNYYAMTSAAAMAEVFAMADTLDVPRQTVYDVMAAGPNHSAMMDFIKQFAIDGEINLAFSLENSLKDVGYYRAMAEAAGARSWMSGAAFDALSEACAAGMGENLVPEILSHFSSHMKD
ncbi:MAG: NAD(P)-dependent oxidoreductase [Mangrovicoccus sp.]